MAELHEQANRLREENEHLRTRFEAGWAEQSRNPARPFRHPVPVKAKRSPSRTTSIYRRMKSYLLEVPRSPAVHYPRTLRKPNLEKGHLVNPAGPSVSQGAGCGKNPAGTNEPQRQLTNMCLTGLGASPRQYHPCTRPSGPPPLRN